MFKTKILKFFRSLIKIFLPLFHKILIKLKINRRVINFLKDKAYFGNADHDFRQIIEENLKTEKIIALDVGAQGGFNSDNFFPSKYNLYFDSILIEPNINEANKLKKNKYILNKGLWSNKGTKELFILGNRPGSSSMFMPNEKNFDLHNIKKKDYKSFEVTDQKKIDCDTLNNLLYELKIENLDYLKIDTQGAELEIMKGLGNYRPLLLRIEAHVFSMYKNVPSWHKLLNYLYELNYVVIDWKGIGSHSSRIPAEMDMILIPNFNNDEGKKLILKYKEKFKSLMLIFGQLNLLKLIFTRFNLVTIDIDKFEDNYFN